MGALGSTRWTLIRKAAQGLSPDREDFAAVYQPAAQAYFLARWRGTPLVSEVDDAVQEVFVDCFRDGGALARADASRPGGFRAFFYGILRTTALSFERAVARRNDAARPLDPAQIDRLEEDAAPVSAFERAWATAVVREAVELFRERAEEEGPEAVRRHEVLRLRFLEGLPVRRIAVKLGEEATMLYGIVKRAKREFQKALLDVVRYHQPGTQEELLGECRRIVALLG